MESCLVEIAKRECNIQLTQGSHEAAHALEYQPSLIPFPATMTVFPTSITAIGLAPIIIKRQRARTEHCWTISDAYAMCCSR